MNLQDMLEYQRPAFSATEELFLDRFFRPLQDHANVTNYHEDEIGNLIFEVAGGSKTIFTAHSDTVAHDEGIIPIGVRRGWFIAPKNHILGADDGVGCWIVQEIINAGIPSLCIITRGEEHRGIGSRFLAENLRGYYRAIAFDRKGTSSVITHQVGGRCCSDTFAHALAAALGEQGLFFYPDYTGVFCDTAEWTEQIPECTNLSVGYENAHSTWEMCNPEFAVALRDAVLKIEWSVLPTEIS